MNTILSNNKKNIIILLFFLFIFSTIPSFLFSKEDKKQDHFEILGNWYELNSDSDFIYSHLKSDDVLFLFEKDKGFCFPSLPLDPKEKKYSFSLAFRLNHLAPEEIELLKDARDGEWNDLNLFDATLIAEGKITMKARSSYREKYDHYVRELKKQTHLLPNDKMKTRVVYEFMHREILTGKYDLNLSSLAASFDRGVFNCVSATILFGALAHEVGLTVAGLETTGHAKSRVFFDQEYLDIETTCTKWNQLPDRLKKRNFSALNDQISQNHKGTSPAADEITTTVARPVISFENSISVSPKNRESNHDFSLPGIVWSGNRKMRQINEVQLIATIYYNRGVDHYQEERYNEALADYVKALQLDPDNKTILGNFKATLNNWAIQLALQKNFPESIRLTEAGLLIDPDFEQFKINLPIFYQHWIAELEKEDRLDEADYLKKKYIERFPDE